VSAGPVLVAVPDLFFATRIATVARLQGVAYEVVNPAQVAARAKAASPRLVIVDLHAPGGIEAVRALRADPATRELPVVGFYSHVDQATRALALEAGASEVLPRSAFTVRLAEILAR